MDKRRIVPVRLRNLTDGKNLYRDLLRFVKCLLSPGKMEEGVWL
jgi:hypothetical protein